MVVVSKPNTGIDARTSWRKKKAINLDAATIGWTGKSKDETMMRILQTQMVNRAMGGAVIGPGDLDKLQDDVIEACYALAVKVPQYSKPKGGLPRGKQKPH